MYTDPNDQSVWMYHRWLVGTGTMSLFRRLSVCFCEVYPLIRRSDGGTELLEREVAAIQELLDEQPDSKCTCGTAQTDLIGI